MRRKLRLRRARKWLATLPTKPTLADYGQKFSVNSLCAAIELRILKVELPPGCEAELRASAEARRLQTKASRWRGRASTDEELDDDPPASRSAPLEYLERLLHDVRIEAASLRDLQLPALQDPQLQTLLTRILEDALQSQDDLRTVRQVIDEHSVEALLSSSDDLGDIPF